MKLFRNALLAVLLTVAVTASGLSVGTLNCYMLFDPSLDRSSRIEVPQFGSDNYARKIENLGGLINGLDFIGVQEIGGREELASLARAAGNYEVFFVKGTDTYTGQNVGALVRIDPGIRSKSASRDRDLDALSKHLVVRLEAHDRTFTILVVHLLRPIGDQKVRQEKQIEAIGAWFNRQRNIRPNDTLIILGDFNNDSRTLFQLYNSSVLTSWQSTHVGGKTLDHIFCSEPIKSATLRIPPFPKRPNDLLKWIWSDHYLVVAELYAVVPVDGRNQTEPFRATPPPPTKRRGSVSGLGGSSDSSPRVQLAGGLQSRASNEGQCPFDPADRKRW